MRCIEKDIVNKITEKTSYQKAVVENIIDVFWETVEEETSKGNSVMFSGYGKFYINLHKGHTVNIPNKADGMKMDDYPVFIFRPSKVFAKNLRDKYENGTVIPVKGKE